MTYYPAYQIRYTLHRIKLLGQRSSHAKHEVQLELATLYTILAQVPKWKLWRWLPLAAKIASAEYGHRDCCKILS